MRAEILKPADLDDGLIETWRAFQARNDGLDSPFFAPEFTMAVGAARDDARVAVISDAGELIAFLPFHSCAGNVAKPIGGQICDYQGLIHTKPFDAPGAQVLHACGLSAYDFNHAPADQTSLAPGAYQFWTSPQMDLTGGYEAYAEDRPKSFREVMREVRRRMRKIEKEFGPLRFEFQDTSDATYDAHIALRNKLYERVNVNSLLGSGSWVDNTLDVLRRTDNPEFAGVFSTLYAGDQFIAGHFGMRSRTVWHWWFNSYDTNFYKFGPGKMLIHHAAQEAEQYGITKIDFGRGDAPYKLDFANTSCALAEGSIEAAISLPGMSRCVQRAVAKSIRQLPLGRYGDLCRRAGNRVLTGGVRV